MWGAFVAVCRAGRLDIGQALTEPPGTQTGQKSMTSPGRIQAIYRYPVKGLSPQQLREAQLSPEQTVQADGLYAIENGPSGFDPKAPAYFPKQRFLMLMRNERLAALRTDYDEASHTLTVHWERRRAAEGDLRTPEGRSAIERFFAE